MIRWCLISSRLLDSLPRPRYPIPSQTALPCNTKPCSCSTISHHLTMPDYNQVKPYINQQAVLFKSRWVERMHGQTATFFDADDMTLILTMVQQNRPELWCFTLVKYSTALYSFCWHLFWPCCRAKQRSVLGTWEGAPHAAHPEQYSGLETTHLWNIPHTATEEESRNTWGRCAGW